MLLLGSIGHARAVTHLQTRNKELRVSAWVNHQNLQHLTLLNSPGVALQRTAHSQSLGHVVYLSAKKCMRI